MRDVAWGQIGETIYDRTYRQTKPDGSFETWWEDTIPRVVDGNLKLVDAKFIESGEREKLIAAIGDFQMLPAGRHLSMSGKPGRQFLFNCWVAGWTKNVADHFVFTFDQLMQGGGVGANYSTRFTNKYKRVRSEAQIHLVCSPEHKDYEEVKPYLSEQYSAAWSGSTRVPDSREGWCDALRDVMEAYWSDDEEIVVLDLSLVRARGERIRTFGGVSSGPSYLAKMLVHVSEILSKRVGNKLNPIDMMTIDHLIAKCVVSGNVRRSSRMSMLWWNDPCIMDFINCKKADGAHWTTNISVVVDSEFFTALRQGEERARIVLRRVVEGMFTNGEPGFYNYSLAQADELNKVFCTNPCGEIPLPEWGNCNLGHINLDHVANVTSPNHASECFRLMTRFLVRATFGDVPNDRAADVRTNERRIGVGFFGFHGWLNKQGIRYSESHHEPIVAERLRTFKYTCREAARAYAYELRIAEPIKVTCVAPTGTVAKLPGVQESMEPCKFRYFDQRVRFSADDPNVEILRQQGVMVEDAINEPNTVVAVMPCKNKLLEELTSLFGEEEAERLFETIFEIPLEDMLAVQTMVQREYCGPGDGNAISFTISVKPGQYGIEEAENIIRMYLPRLKGTTIMVDESRAQSPFTEITKAEYEQGNNRFLSESTDEDCATGACDFASRELVRAE